MSQNFKAPLLGLIVATGAFLLPSPALAATSHGCELDENGVLVGLDLSTYSEEEQYLNMLNFYSVTMAPSPLRSPGHLEALRFDGGLELSYVPQLTCRERAVFEGTKIENTNKTFVFPRIRLGGNYTLTGLPTPVAVSVGIHGVPPVTLLGVTTLVFGGDLSVGTRLSSGVELGLRGYYVFGRVKGDLAGPFDPETQALVDDVFRTRVFGAELMAGYRIDRGENHFTPYLGLGGIRTFSYMYVGENHPSGFDETLASKADAPESGSEGGLYTGPTLELGVEALLGKVDVAFELYGVPLNIITASDRFFFSPRLRVGYTFF